MISQELYQYNSEWNAYRIQGSGTINSTGQMFYFRYESGCVRLTILKLQRNEDWIYNNIAAEYCEFFDHVDDSPMPLSIVLAFLNRLIGTYLAGSDLRRKLAAIA